VVGPGRVWRDYLKLKKVKDYRTTNLEERLFRDGGGSYIIWLFGGSERVFGLSGIEFGAAQYSAGGGVVLRNAEGVRAARGEFS
jgi:hypothetical protein